MLREYIRESSFLPHEQYNLCNPTFAGQLTDKRHASSPNENDFVDVVAGGEASTSVFTPLILLGNSYRRFDGYNFHLFLDMTSI